MVGVVVFREVGVCGGREGGVFVVEGFGFNSLYYEVGSRMIYVLGSGRCFGVRGLGRGFFGLDFEKEIIRKFGIWLLV